MTAITIMTASRTYSVHVGAGLLGSLSSLIAGSGVSPGRIHAVIDAGLPASVQDGLRSALAAGVTRSTPLSVSIVRPTESEKSLQTLQHVLQDVAQAKLERGDVILALGGGIISDLAGMVAATYRRGIAWIALPTTLLSMVDASVGGKTGVNLRVGGELYKNMVGAFWQPSLVVADPALLASLPERDFRSGLAECLKHGLLSADASDPELMGWTRGHLAAVLSRDPGTLAELVARNIRVKASIVGTDEREEAPSSDGGRALLNLGHTFGHAIETIDGDSSKASPGFWPVTHGEGVSLGMICAARFAELARCMPVGFVDELRGILGHAGLPSRAPGLPASGGVYERMLHDKKASGGRLRLVIPCGEARCRVVVDPSREMVLEAIDAVRA